MFILLSVFILLITSFYFFRRNKFKVLEKAGIKGPKPNFIFGNLIEYHKAPFYELLLKWNKEYGKVFVYFEGPTPNLVIGDPDLIQEVMIKQFSNFHGRKLFPLQKNPDKDERASMFIARGKRWKRLRMTINPAFSESKMKQMFPLIDKSIQSLIHKVNDFVGEAQENVEIQEKLQRLTMDIICKCAFGVDTDYQTNFNHPLIVAVKKFQSEISFATITQIIALTFPEIKPCLIKLLELLGQKQGQKEDFKVIRNTLIKVIEARKNNTEKRFDLLQLLLDAEEPGSKILEEEEFSCPINDKISNEKPEGTTDEDNTGDNSGESKSKTQSKTLTTEEVIAQANLFLFAGYETSSTAMSYFMHTMATNPEIQNKLLEEIDRIYLTVKSKDTGSRELYDALVKLPYLNAVIYEILRFYPFASTVINRLCLKSNGTYLSNGLYIPKDMNIIPNVYAIHFDENIWTTSNPQIFDPERFLLRNGSDMEFIGPPHPLAWLPFGSGPRNCIGQRFAMMVIKATIGRFFYDFKVSPSAKTENPIQLKVGGTISPKNGVNLKITKRDH